MKKLLFALLLLAGCAATRKIDYPDCCEDYNHIVSLYAKAQARMVRLDSLILRAEALVDENMQIKAELKAARGE